jgi:hypothetical protein
LYPCLIGPSSCFGGRPIGVLGDNEPVGASRAEDTLAIDIYRHAEETGQQIT